MVSVRWVCWGKGTARRRSCLVGQMDVRRSLLVPTKAYPGSRILCQATLRSIKPELWIYIATNK